MLQAMDRLTRLGVVSLPIHDALMVTDGMLSVDAAQKHLKDAWSETLGARFASHVAVNRPWAEEHFLILLEGDSY